MTKIGIITNVFIWPSACVCARACVCKVQDRLWRHNKGGGDARTPEVHRPLPSRQPGSQAASHLTPAHNTCYTPVTVIRDELAASLLPMFKQSLLVSVLLDTLELTMIVYVHENHHCAFTFPHKYWIFMLCQRLLMLTQKTICNTYVNNTSFHST